MENKLWFNFSANPEFIHLIIYYDGTDDKELEQLNNYVYKYSYSENEDNIKLYDIQNIKIELNIKENEGKYNYTFSLEPILGYKYLNDTYYINIFSLTDYIKGKNNNSIALKQSKSYIRYYFHKYYSDNIQFSNDKIILIIYFFGLCHHFLLLGNKKKFFWPIFEINKCII